MPRNLQTSPKEGNVYKIRRVCAQCISEYMVHKSKPISTCISLSIAFFMLSGFGAYGGNVFAKLSAAAAITTICSSVNSDTEDADDGLNDGGDVAVPRIS